MDAAPGRAELLSKQFSVDNTDFWNCVAAKSFDSRANTKNISQNQRVDSLLAALPCALRHWKAFLPENRAY
ncbi:hypothetical protein [Rhizobium sp. RHZ01]|uniref:hypothetical protein n=1 Tax=Rhizobium sp. RHZ01 TaxID=2769304 RepID=UPI001785ED08|nr:hypothetical protein [Rhizobium sp. RHZ01]MBD9449699.1 hypothetical protein [Rhizobium sp. RHZ01]